MKTLFPPHVLQTRTMIFVLMVKNLNKSYHISVDNSPKSVNIHVLEKLFQILDSTGLLLLTFQCFQTIVLLLPTIFPILFQLGWIIWRRNYNSGTSCSCIIIKRQIYSLVGWLSGCLPQEGKRVYLEDINLMFRGAVGTSD